MEEKQTTKKPFEGLKTGRTEGKRLPTNQPKRQKKKGGGKKLEIPF